MQKPAPPAVAADWLRLDPALDPKTLGAVLTRHGRLHIPGVFTPGGAPRYAITGWVRSKPPY